MSATVFLWQDKQNVRPCNPEAAAAIADRCRHAQSVRRRNQHRNAKAALADGAQASDIGDMTDGGKTRASANQRRGLNVVMEKVRCKQRERGLGKEAATVSKPKKNTAVTCCSPGTMSAAVTKMSVGFQACGGQSVSEGKEHERWITRLTTGRLIADRLHVQLLRYIAKVDALPLAGGELAAGAALKAVLDAAPEGLHEGTSSGEDAAQVNAALGDLRVRVTAAGAAVVEAVKHRASAEINYDKADRRRLLSEIKSLTPDEVSAPSRSTLLRQPRHARWRPRQPPTNVSLSSPVSWHRDGDVRPRHFTSPRDPSDLPHLAPVVYTWQPDAFIAGHPCHGQSTASGEARRTTR